MDFLPGSCGPGIAWCVVYEILFAAAASALALAAVTFAANVLYRQPRYRRQQRILERLAVLRTEGVEIRNMRPPRAFLRPPTPDDMNLWLSTWYAVVWLWFEALYDTADEFSPVEAERLRTLDWMKPRALDGLLVADNQVSRLLELSQTLERLDIMLQQRFRPQDAP